MIQRTILCLKYFMLEFVWKWLGRFMLFLPIPLHPKIPLAFQDRACMTCIRPKMSQFCYYDPNLLLWSKYTKFNQNQSLFIWESNTDSIPRQLVWGPKKLSYATPLWWFYLIKSRVKPKILDFFGLLKLTSGCFAALWAARMPSISFESHNNIEW